MSSCSNMRPKAFSFLMMVMMICNGHSGHGCLTGKSEDSCVLELGCKVLQMWSGLDQHFKFSNFVSQVQKPFRRVWPRAFVKYFIDLILAMFVC